MHTLNCFFNLYDRGELVSATARVDPAGSSLKSSGVYSSSSPLAHGASSNDLQVLPAWRILASCFHNSPWCLPMSLSHKTFNLHQSELHQFLEESEKSENNSAIYVCTVLLKHQLIFNLLIVKHEHGQFIIKGKLLDSLPANEGFLEQIQ